MVGDHTGILGAVVFCLPFFLIFFLLPSHFLHLFNRLFPNQLRIFWVFQQDFCCFTLTSLFLMKFAML
ncbi:hypothetical protein C8R48DRAFT_744124 [Suillus tomentosus]|nr:hypothetical protein C8R48DRAFT_744124 [Suillus tomentosus]